jgi:hypothetical protein
MSKNKAPTSGEGNEGEAWEDPDDSIEETQQSHQAGYAPAEKSNVQSRDEIMRALGRLPGLIALKVLSPSQANAMRSAYQTRLAEHSRSQPELQSQISNESVLQLLSEQLHLLSMLEPFMSQDQIDMVMRSSNDNM